MVNAAPLRPGSFHGKPLGQRRLGNRTLVESAYPPGVSIPTHVHSRAFFYLVLDGVCFETFDGSNRTAQPFTLVYHPAGSAHSDKWGVGGGRCFSFEISQRELGRAAAIAPVVDHSIDIGIGDAVWLAARLYSEFRRPDNVSHIAVEELVWGVLAEMAQGRRLPQDQPPPWLVRARELLHDRFTERLLLSDVAESAGVHPMHLCRAFRKYYGHTIGNYIRELRLVSASRKLICSPEPIVEIALDAGYSDQSHFTNSFRRRTGMTPVAFRRSLCRKIPNLP